MLATWAEIDAVLEPNAPLQARVRDGVFARLLELHAPEGLAEVRPECLPALTHVLVRSTEPSDGRRRARLLVRDALVAGRGLEPLDFRHDPPVADLLAENLAAPEATQSDLGRDKKGEFIPVQTRVIIAVRPGRRSARCTPSGRVRLAAAGAV